ncbi:hypothetical protein NECAME_00103 [Necator americanus]|uniref:Uncharacterized protein n=1 Tax=Necator americanus TaxID=51031 RepID=W2TZY3_NECAM|nr:hypothetical protein NECAME_00103 [Necator americanus]ETN87244.1 hypothetical protein NECAME_00103 [Necator americanus]
MVIHNVRIETTSNESGRELLRIRMSYMRDTPIYDGKSDYLGNPTDFNVNTVQTTKTRESRVQVMEVEAIDCSPGMCAHPMALLRWFQLLEENKTQKREPGAVIDPFGS